MSLLRAITRYYSSHTFIEQRQSIREHVCFPARIETVSGAPRIECTVLDVSDSGARVSASSKTSFPKEFWLVFSKDGTRRRRCRMAWRSGEQMGLKYLAPLQIDRPLS
jgi:hypothetical protein